MPFKFIGSGLFGIFSCSSFGPFPSI